MGRGGQREKAIVHAGRKEAMALSEGSREFISVLETISAAGHIILPFIIYQGKIHRASYYLNGLSPTELPIRKTGGLPRALSGGVVLMNVGVKGISSTAVSIKTTWRGVECKDTTFAVFPSGYMDDDLGFAYISDHFEPMTRNNSKPRILIVDGHSSHIHYRVVQFALNHGIHMICLPPHSTHLMQPLDVGCFGLMQRAYQRYLQSWFAANPTGLISKAVFHGLLTLTRQEVFTAEIILAAWKKSGCWPIDLDYARGFQPTTPGPPKHAVCPNTPGRMKQIAAEIEAEIPIPLKDKFQACTDFMIQTVIKY